MRRWYLQVLTENSIFLGGGVRLFDSMDQRLEFELLETQVLLGQLVKRHCKRQRI